MLFFIVWKAFFGYRTFINAFSELILAKKKGWRNSQFLTKTMDLRHLDLFFSKLASGRNPAIWLVPRAGGIFRSCPLTRAESLAASFTSLFFKGYNSLRGKRFHLAWFRRKKDRFRPRDKWNETSAAQKRLLRRLGL